MGADAVHVGVHDLRRAVSVRREEARTVQSYRSALVALTGLGALACGDKEAGSAGPSAADYAALAERVAVLEAEVAGGSDGAGGDGGGGDPALEARVAELESGLTDAQDGLADLSEDLDAAEADLSALSDAVAAADLSVIEGRLAAVESALAAAGGGVWFEEGSGSGTCARVDVVTAVDRPLVVMATVESSTGTLGGSVCFVGSGSACGATPSSAGGSGETTATVVTEGVSGSGFEARESRTEGSTFGTSLTAISYTTMSNSLRTSWTIPITQVVEIPSAGAYTVEVQVSSTATPGACRLVVVQP
jgi:hypothetical protein